MNARGGRGVPFPLLKSGILLAPIQAVERHFPCSFPSTTNEKISVGGGKVNEVGREESECTHTHITYVCTYSEYTDNVFWKGLFMLASRTWKAVAIFKGNLGQGWRYIKENIPAFGLVKIQFVLCFLLLLVRFLMPFLPSEEDKVRKCFKEGGEVWESE